MTQLVNSSYAQPSVKNIRVVFEKNSNGISYKYLFGPNNIKLCWVQNFSIFNKDDVNLNSCTVNQPSVLTSYSTQLLPKAIGYSAGVIKLFFSETAKGNKGKDVALLQTTPVGYGNTLLGAIGNGVQSLFGNIKNEISPSPARSEDVSNLFAGQDPTETIQNIVTPPIVGNPQ